MFENAKVGDKVFSILDGWGKITRINRLRFPLVVEFENGITETFTLDGMLYLTNKYPTLFWDEVKVEKLPKLENKEHYQIAKEIFDSYIAGQNIGEGLATIISLLLAAIDNSGMIDEALEVTFNALEDYKKESNGN